MKKMLLLFRASDAKELILGLDIPDCLQQVEIVSNILRPEMIRRQYVILKISRKVII